MIAKDLSDARKIVEAYEELVDRALGIVSDVPFYASVDDDDHGVALTFDGDKAVLSWTSYDSDYYGGGSLNDDSSAFPAEVLFMPDKELSALRARVKEEEQERQRKVAAAEEAVRRQRAEARDRSEYARLCKKYGAPATEKGKSG